MKAMRVSNFFPWQAIELLRASGSILPFWSWGIRVSSIAILLTAGCAKSQPNEPIAQENAADELLADPEAAWFAPAPPETTRLRLPNFELMEVEAQPFQALIGHFEGQEVEIISQKDSLCLDAVGEQDLDGDNYPEILLLKNEACTGRCCLNPYFVVSYRGHGKYSVSQSEGQAFREPVFERWQGKWSIVIENSPEQTITTALAANKERFLLEEGKLVKAEDIVPYEMIAVQELRASYFDSHPETDTLKLSCDLDGDGKMDVLWGTFWKRYARVMWNVQFANGTTMLDGTPFKRLGVLPTVTEGHHDLVIDVDRVLEWKGKRYEEREQ